MKPFTRRPEHFLSDSASKNAQGCVAMTLRPVAEVAVEARVGGGEGGLLEDVAERPVREYVGEAARTLDLG